MSSTVWDQEFFRRRVAGRHASGHAQEPAAAAPLAAEWQAAIRSAFLQQFAEHIHQAHRALNAVTDR